MEDYIVGIGKRIKELRKKNNLTIHNIASSSGVSNGLISRVENGRTIPSLPVLISIIHSLGIDVPGFFQGLPQHEEKKYIITRKSEHSVIEKEDEAIGFEYRYLFGKQFISIGFEAILLEIQPGSKREKVETDAYEMKLILSGDCSYQIGDDEVLLHEGDTLFFDGRVPHVPVNNGKIPCKMLVIYFFNNTLSTT